jgi:hypothetical protein
MTSRITSLHELYGKYNEILPEEITKSRNEGRSIFNELENHKCLLHEILTEDVQFIEVITRQNGLRPLIKELPNRETIIRWAFELDDNQDHKKKKTELIKRSLAQWLVCKETLILLSQGIIDELAHVIDTYDTYKKEPESNREKRMAYISFTRYYQNFIGYSANIRDIIDEYHDIFNIACKQIDSNYEIDYSWRRSAVFTSELKRAVMELLLRGYLGRFTPFPLMRSYIEVLLTRSLLNTKYSNKYKDRNIVLLKDFKTDDIWWLMRQFNAGTLLQIHATSLLYDWGSMSVHRAIRMLHSMMWYSIIFTDILVGILQGVRIDPDKLDSIIDNLLTNNKIKVFQSQEM